MCACGRMRMTWQGNVRHPLFTNLKIGALDQVSVTFTIVGMDLPYDDIFRGE